MDRPQPRRREPLYTVRLLGRFDYPGDIQALAEHLQLPGYYIIGTSGCTGCTLACAKDLPRSRLKGVGIWAEIGPYECDFESMSELRRKALEAWQNYPAEFRGYFDQDMFRSRSRRI